MNVLEIKNLNKSFSDFSLKNISFTIPMGAIMGFVGENGAGKTTTIKLILNQLKADSGTIQLFDLDHREDEIAVKNQIGVVLDEGFFYEEINPMQIGKILSSVYSSWDPAYYLQMLSQFSLPEKKKIKIFSKGMRAKLSLAAALAHHPLLLILDEPTSGLDPMARREILDVFLDFIQDEKHSILFSSHITGDLEKIADYVTYLHQGEIAFSQNKDELLQTYGILKCGKTELSLLSPEEYCGYQKSAFGYEILVPNLSAIKKKFPQSILEAASLEQIMMLFTKKEA